MITDVRLVQLGNHGQLVVGPKEVEAGDDPRGGHHAFSGTDVAWLGHCAQNRSRMRAASERLAFAELSVSQGWRKAGIAMAIATFREENPFEVRAKQPEEEDLEIVED